MTDEFIPDAVPRLNPIALQIAESLVGESDGRAELVRDDRQHWLAIEETATTIAFAEAEGDELRVVPFVGDAEVEGRPYVASIGPSWLDGERELVINVATLSASPHLDEALQLLRAALNFWAPSDSADPSPIPPVVPTFDEHVPDLGEVDFSQVTGDEVAGDGTVVEEPTILARLRADISDQWSWASSTARIPQISDLTVELSEPVELARVNVTVSDADVQYGTRVAFEGSLPAGTTLIGSVHIPVSARAMSQIEERRAADCAITLEDVGVERVLARADESIDIQPRDLWFWMGDPRRSEQRQRMVSRYTELVALAEEDPDRHDLAEIDAELKLLKRVVDDQDSRSTTLARSLLASFVRPNHPEIGVLAREAADMRGRVAGEASFHAFQLPERDSSERRIVAQSVEHSITAVYETVRARGIAYSEPPPGWDYTQDGQRIRDHGDVAKGGLGTCMDTTVLTAAVIEHVGLYPVLVLVPGHIFVGYWRLDPAKSGTAGSPDWYSREPVTTDASHIRNLVEAEYLGLIETTALTVSNNASPNEARDEARQRRLAGGLREGEVTLIDVAAARRAGVSALPAVNERPDGIAEIYEYRPGESAVVTEVELKPLDPATRERQVDSHPARYRTWKSSLFSLNATNALLNLGNNARVQPLVLPPEGLGVLEDKLNQDVSFSLHSGYDVPEVLAARDIHNALLLLESGRPEDRKELLAHLNERRIYVQRIGRSGGNMTALGEATFFKEVRSIANNAKSAREERGMNPLFLCLGLFRWEYKPDVFAEAPLILVPVNITVARGRKEFTLSLDTSQQTTPNAALIEWLRREHGLVIPGLVEPLADRAGIDVDEVIGEVRNALIERTLSTRVEVVSEARLATLDLSAFRMWQDLNHNAESFIERPLVRHLVETPTEQFEDPAIEAAGEAAMDVAMADELEKLDTPIPADSTQKRAVLWARQGRTFVLQGPPGTGKSQTITNMVAECIMSGLRVLFVAEKGTALAVVQRRLDAIGLGPFTLNLHHEGSNATEVRAQLKSALTASVTPDPTAMESARRRLRNARFELMQYPQHLHEANAAGLSAYSAHDQLLVLGDGPTLPVPMHLVAHQAETIGTFRELFENLQQWTAAAGVRPDHPWRLAGIGAGEPFDLEAVGRALTGILDGTRWASTTTGTLREALDAITHPEQLQSLAAAADRVLPSGDDLTGILSAEWPTSAPETVAGCEHSIAGWAAQLRGFSPDVLEMDLRAIAGELEEANASGVFGRSKRQLSAIAALAAVAPRGLDVQPGNAAALLNDLVATQDAGASVRSALNSVPGLGSTVPSNPFRPGALQPVRVRLDELLQATAGLRDRNEWTQRVHTLAQAGHLSQDSDSLSSYSTAWQQLWDSLVINEPDFQAWRGDRTLLTATEAISETWRRQIDFERLLPLQNWCTLVRKLEPLREAGLDTARVELLEGNLPAYVAEDALARGVAQASLDERVSAAGLDRFNSVAHDQRVTSYSEAQAEVRKQWASDGPATLLERRGGGGAGKHTGGLARELEKTTKKLGTRPILRKHGEAVQELTPLVLCSPSSVVDLIEPGVMEFDVVIFDEASQITVPEAVGALGRASAAIVVGDSKQMPPTRKVGGGAVDDEDIDDPDVEEIVEDQESILSECELARVPTLSLNWHYRSQDEALIAFSNRAYYRGDLSSFPTPTLLSSETGMEFRRVEGQYLRAGSTKVELGNGVVAGSNTNPVEATAIVDAIHELVNAGDELPSVGIVTFNEQQRQLIEDLLLASTNRKVADVMDVSVMGRGEELFVKALEQVQGDERDVVIFSIAFSKQANGKIPTNFGPLSNSGGERRLNVAVTRARRRNVVFCSFEPAELDVSGSTFNGPKDLKEFLTFAKASGSAQETGDTGQRIAIRDRHRDDIADALRGAGLHVMSDVGLSNFRLDLVLARPDTPTRPILPVLLDGESWMKRHTVSDRDVLPVEVLQNLMGWPTVARIWWPMWLQNRQEVIDLILTEVDRAEAQLDGVTIEPEPAAPEPTLDEPGPFSVEDPSPDPDFGITATYTEPPIAETASSPASDGVEPSHVEPKQAEPIHIASEPLSPVAPLPSPGAEAEIDHARPRNDPSTIVDEPVAPALGGHGGDHAAVRGVDAITEFVSAHTSVVGSKDVLDALPDRSAAAKVREQVVDVIEAEGPVEVARLARIVARRFGLNAVRAARADDIMRLIPRAQLRKSRKFGHFAWPTGLDSDVWYGFRVADQNNSRTLEEIAPEEIANGMCAVLEEYPELEYVDDVLRRTAELFGISKLGAKIRARLEAVYETLPAEEDDAPTAPPTTPNPTPAPPAAPATKVPAADPEPAPTPQAVAPAGPVTRPVDPVVEKLAANVDRYVPDLSRVDEFYYVDFVAQRPLSVDLRRLVDEIVLDPDYDGSPGHKGVGARASHLSIDDAHAVGNSASMVWNETVGNALGATAQSIATHLARDPDFEPLPWQEDINNFVENRLQGKRPGLVALVQQRLNLHAEETGLVAQLEAEIQREARTALDAMEPLDRDIYGFTSRNAKRLQLAEPYIGHVKESHQRFVVYWMSRFEAEESGLKREARYATAVRALVEQGETRAAISRTLGISTSIMDRIQRENRRDVALAPDDPILTELATDLR